MSQEYLEAAKTYLVANNRSDVVSATEAIRGVWVASDVKTIVDEARALVDRYFPAVQLEHVVCVSFGEEGEPETDAPALSSHDQVCII